MLALFATQSALAQSAENPSIGPYALLVAVVVVVIAGIVYRSKQDQKAQTVLAAAPPAAVRAAEKTVVAPGSFGEISLRDVDDRTAAMLMAIVADELKTPLNQLRFLSVRQLKEGK